MGMGGEHQTTITIKSIRFIENAEINIYDALDGFFLLKYPLLMTGFWNIIGCGRVDKSLLQLKTLELLNKWPTMAIGESNM